LNGEWRENHVITIESDVGLASFKERKNEQARIVNKIHEPKKRSENTESAH
jgi:hypothetical protein